MSDEGRKGGFQFSLAALLVWAVGLPACVGAVVVGVQTEDSLGFLLAVLCLAFFAWVAIKQTKHPAYTMLGVFAFFIFWPIMLFLWPITLLSVVLLFRKGRRYRH